MLERIEDDLNDYSEDVVIGATNRPGIIDEAVRRPGRLGKEIHVLPPDEDAAREISSSIFGSAPSRNCRN